MAQYPNNPGNVGPPSMPGAPGWGGPNAGGMQQRPGVAPVAITAGHKWPALRFIVILLKVIAWIQLALGLVLAVATGFAGSSLLANFRIGGFSGFGGTGLIAALIELIVVVLTFIWTYASAEIIMLFITIEKNTRPRY